MNSNSGSPIRNSPFGDRTGTTVDPDAVNVGANDTGAPLGAPYRHDDNEQSGIRRTWDDARSRGSGVVSDVEGNITERYDETRGGVSYPALSQESIDRLNECLRGELSAVEAYDLALRSIHSNELSDALRQLRDSHERRVALLRDRLRSVSAEASQSSGAWGALARLVQRGADLFGDKAAVAALEEGEDHGIRLYTEDLEAIDVQTLEFIRADLLPEQERTHDLCKSLHRFLNAA